MKAPYQTLGASDQDFWKCWHQVPWSSSWLPGFLDPKEQSWASSVTQVLQLLSVALPSCLFWLVFPFNITAPPKGCNRPRRSSLSSIWNRTQLLSALLHAKDVFLLHYLKTCLFVIWIQQVFVEWLKEYLLTFQIQ